jgi:hypothetical protein
MTQNGDSDKDLEQSAEATEETKPAEQHRRIRRAAFYRGEKRGPEGAHELADWPAAANEVASQPPTTEDD